QIRARRRSETPARPAATSRPVPASGTGVVDPTRVSVSVAGFAPESIVYTNEADRPPSPSNVQVPRSTVTGDGSRKGPSGRPSSWVHVTMPEVHVIVPTCASEADPNTTLLSVEPAPAALPAASAMLSRSSTMLTNGGSPTWYGSCARLTWVSATWPAASSSSVT